MRKLKLRGHIGSNQVTDLVTKAEEELRVITNNGKEVLIASVIDEMEAHTMNMSEDDHDKLVKLFTTIVAPNEVSTSKLATRARISDFVTGYLLGRFMVNTKAVINTSLLSPLTGNYTNAD